MSLLEELKGLGANVDEALDRIMGDVGTYEMLLGMFIDSVDGNPISREEFDSADLGPLIQKVHMFKGVTGNLSITPLFTGYQEILDLLRTGRAQEAKAGYDRLAPVQASVLDCLRRHQAE